MRRLVVWTFAVVCFLVTVNALFAAPAVAVLGKEYSFPNKIEGLPAKLSDFEDLQINSFETDDGVKLTYWEAGTGQPLIFIPGWSANGAEYINVMYLLRKHYHVFVLDPRNQGLSQKVKYGTRIARYAADLREFTDHIGVHSAYYCGWSMGASVLWSYIDLYGTQGIQKAIFIDEPPSILNRPGWTAQDRLNAGSMVDTPEQLIQAFTSGAPNPVLDRFKMMDSPYFANSEGLAQSFIQNDMQYLILVMFDHASQDWQDVISRKINVPTAIFTGDYSPNLPSQRWMKSVIPNSTLYVYSKAEQGDHFLAFKNPVKFTRDLEEFLQRKDSSVPSVAGERDVTKETLLSANAAWNNDPYVAYPAGRPELTVLRITVPAHGELPWHSHPMPNAAYVVSGEITIEEKSGVKKHFSAGQVIPETVNTLHHGFVGDTPAVFLVFYPGTKRMPLSQARP
jgi:non-heme chloroperoxidase